jgi:hypothetical protein
MGLMSPCFTSICLVCVLSIITSSEAINWLNADISLNVSILTLEENVTKPPWLIEVAMSSNREIYREDGGHFRFSISGNDSKVGYFSAMTPCVEIGAPASDVRKLISTTEYSGVDDMATLMPLSNIMDVSVKRFGDGKLASNFSTLYKVNFRTPSVFLFDVEVTQTDCAPIETFGYWDDARNWEGGATPTVMDDVFLPEDSGLIELSQDVTVMSLNMLGGTLILQTTGCNNGWSLGRKTGSLE